MIRFQIYRPGPAGKTFDTQLGGYPATVEICALATDSPCTINTMTMDAGDKIGLENINEPLIGAYLATGSLIDQLGVELQFNGQWTTEWSSNPRTGTFTAGSQGAYWVCLQGTGTATLVSQVPANMPFVALEGQIGYFINPTPTNMAALVVNR